MVGEDEGEGEGKGGLPVTILEIIAEASSHLSCLVKTVPLLTTGKTTVRKR